MRSKLKIVNLCSILDRDDVNREGKNANKPYCWSLNKWHRFCVFGYIGGYLLQTSVFYAINASPDYYKLTDTNDAWICFLSTTGQFFPTDIIFSVNTHFFGCLCSMMAMLIAIIYKVQLVQNPRNVSGFVFEKIAELDR